MKIDFTVLERQYKKYQTEYEESALRVLRSGWYILGKELSSFESQFAQINGVNNCVGVGNGLDALSLSLTALGIGKGDEVIVQANTFIASALAITVSGATPVFADVDSYYTIDSESIKAMITSKTKAIMVVHLYGQMCDMDAIMSIAKQYGLYVIEDCAQAHLATYRNKMAGTIGDIGCFSFYPTKTISAFGDAGAVITSNDELAERVRMLRNYGSHVKYVHETTGTNSRLDEIQAAMLQVSLKHAAENNKERKDIANRYLHEITNPQIILPTIRPENLHVWYVFAIRCKKRDSLVQYLVEQGIHVQIHYPIPCHLAPCYKEFDYKKGTIPVSETYANEVLSLPIFIGLTEKEVQYIINAINLF